MRTVRAALLLFTSFFRLCRLFRHAVFLLTETLVLEPLDPVVVLPSETKVTVMVEVVTSSGATAHYSVDVSKGSSLLEALEHLKGRNVGFT